MQRIDHPDAAQANAQALHDLENGATGLEFEFAGGPGARGFGIADASRETLARLCEGIYLDAGVMIALNPVLGRETQARISPMSLKPAKSIPLLSTSILTIKRSAPRRFVAMRQPPGQSSKGHSARSSPA